MYSTSNFTMWILIKMKLFCSCFLQNIKVNYSNYLVIYLIVLFLNKTRFKKKKNLCENRNIAIEKYIVNNLYQYKILLDYFQYYTSKYIINVIFRCSFIIGDFTVSDWSEYGLNKRGGLTRAWAVHSFQNVIVFLSHPMNVVITSSRDKLRRAVTEQQVFTMKAHRGEKWKARL